MLESYTRDQGLNFVKRKGYHWAPEVTGHQGEAYLDRLEVSIVPEAMIRFSSLESGQSDFTVDAPAQNAKAIRQNPDLHIRSLIRRQPVSQPAVQHREVPVSGRGGAPCRDQSG